MAAIFSLQVLFDSLAVLPILCTLILLTAICCKPLIAILALDFLEFFAVLARKLTALLFKVLFI